MPPLKYKLQLAKARKASNARELLIAKQYFQAGPSISNLYNAFMHWYNSVPVLGGQPEDGNLYITGEAPNPGMRNPKDIVQTAKSVVNIGNAIKRNSKILQKLTKIAKSKSSNAIQPRNNTNILENPPQEIYVDFENLPGFSERDLALQLAMLDAGSGSTYSLSYFGMSPRQVYERAMQDWQNIPVGSSFALVADGALSTDSAPMVYGMMSRFKDEAKLVPVTTKDGGLVMQSLSSFGRIYGEPAINRINAKIENLNRVSGLNLPYSAIDPTTGSIMIPSVYAKRIKPAINTQ